MLHNSWRECLCEVDEDDPSGFSAEALSESMPGEMMTGPDFGCIHYAARNDFGTETGGD